eukprot:SAG31_NODE_372_length_16598_cov_44.705982_8_plen_57_part_00
MMNTAQYNKCAEVSGQAAEFVPMVNGIGQLDEGVTSHFELVLLAPNTLINQPRQEC